MNDSRSKLKRLADGKIIEARTRYSVGRSQIADFKLKWRPALFEGIRHLIRSKKPPENWPLSLFWHWPTKVAEIRGDRAYVGVCIIANRTTQGLAIIRLGVASRLRPRARLAYIEYLQAAPWNQSVLNPKPAYAGVGTALIEGAIRISNSKGYQGRIGLHSLPESESFYRDACGMTDLGGDPDWDDQTYFEFDENGADSFQLRRRR